MYKKIIGEYLNKGDWRLKENSNMSYSVQGLNNHIASTMSAKYWLDELYSSRIRNAHINGDLHIHDLGLLAPYCMGLDMMDLLLNGFRGNPSKVESKPPKRFTSVLGQLVNYMCTTQTESAGAQAVSSFDTYLAPFVRSDGLCKDQIKQGLQEFVFSLNIPTRIGAQCLSEDTEILTKDGWASHNEVSVGDEILTYNIKTEEIETKKVKRMYNEEYEGKMYNLKNRDFDQLISPGHRVVRRKANGGDVEIIEVEEMLKMKGPYNIPIKTNGISNGQELTGRDRDKMLLAAWLISEGSVDRHGDGIGRMSISQKADTDGYHRIKEILDRLGFLVYERTNTHGWGTANSMRLNSEDSREMHEFFNSNKYDGIKFIPDVVKNSSNENLKDFIAEYLKGDGDEDRYRTSTIFPKLLDDFGEIAIKAGYSVNIWEQKLGLNNVNRLFVLNFRRGNNAYIQKEHVREVDYKGRIWCPNTDNDTVIARRNGKTFITGNSPFTNITLDATADNALKDEHVIIGGEIMDEKYGDYEEEIGMINDMLFEIYLEGDGNGKPFSFPIPTYNITKDFKWDNPYLRNMWKATAKYGTPYFANYVNSDMDPKDIKSMCCRLSINLKEIKKRGGGLFGANPLTGSINVVTINLARIGYLSKTEDEYFKRLDDLIAIAVEVSEIKRSILEKYTDDGLFPYIAYALRNVKERFGEYWKNHFSTIGVNGMNESCLNFIGEDIGSEKGKSLAVKVLTHINERIVEIQEETSQMYNLEATPAEGTTYRFAKKDKELYKDIIVANNNDSKKGAPPYYTSSTWLHVNSTDDVIEMLDHQNDLQTLYSGGTVAHIFLGEKLDNGNQAKKFVKMITSRYRIPYISMSPTFSVCEKHGYLTGEHKYCPKCDEEVKNNK